MNFNNRNLYYLIVIVIIILITVVPPIFVYYKYKDILIFSPDVFINEWIKISITSVILVILLERLRNIQKSRLKTIERFELFVSPLIELKEMITKFKNKWDFNKTIHNNQIKIYNKEISMIGRKYKRIKKYSQSLVEEFPDCIEDFERLDSIITLGFEYKCKKRDLNNAIAIINKLITLK